MKNFLIDIEKIAPLSTECKEVLLNKLEPFNVERKKKILRIGEVCNYIYYLNSGLIRTYSFYKEKEVTQSFLTEGNFFSSWESFIRKKVSDLVIEVIEPSYVLGINRLDLVLLCRKYPEINLLYQRIKNNVMFQSLKRAQSLANLTAVERYREFSENNSYILQRSPLVYIASYLGITPETLSRIRCNQFYNKVTESRN